MNDTPQLRPVMLAGTGSDVGKSILATALCRIFVQDGYHPAPFKAQNMALNSYVTPDGLELGRAQAVQAEAACVPCHTDMNPVLLKPQSDHTSQVVLFGRPIGSMSARAYFRSEGRERLRTAACEAFDRLAARYSPVVMEGAGSISELNLRDTDIVNLPMARYARAAVILVADIDRGGVFASAYGSIALQTPEDRALIRGIIVNKFRGDIGLFSEGRRLLEQLCGVPVLGVVPYIEGLHIDAEDSVALDAMPSEPASERVSVGVVRLPHISNYTDFDALTQQHGLHVFYTTDAATLLRADIILVPGSKATVADLAWLYATGIAAAVQQAAAAGTPVAGICGGYQMMGRQVLDPEGLEGSGTQQQGLGLLPVVTTITRSKRTRQVRFALCDSDAPGGDGSCMGYEIHQGRTVAVDGATAPPFATLDDGTPDGCRLSPRLWGTYIHGVFDNPQVVSMLLTALHSDKISSFAGTGLPAVPYATVRQRQYDRLAQHVRRHVDIDRIYDILRTPYSLDA